MVVCKREFYVIVVVIDTHGFDVILGMNWHSTSMQLLNVGRGALSFMCLIIQSLSLSNAAAR